MTDTPMTPDRLPFFQPGHLYAARVGWPEGRERFRFLCESVTTDAGTGQLVAYGQHGRLRTADSQWIWTPNPRTHDDWKGGAWTDITDWTSLLAEVDRLREALSDATGQVAELEDGLGQASAENAAMRERTREAARPSRFSATPAQVDAFLRQHFAEDTYLGFQQAIGAHALEEAVEDAGTVRASADNDGLYNADWREGWDDAIERVDPDRNGPTPVQLVEFGEATS